MKPQFDFSELLPNDKEYFTPENVAKVKQAVQTFNEKIGYYKGTNLREVAKIAIEAKRETAREN